jgi:hypothetical protein
MEDDDPRKQKWQYANEFAKSNILDRVRTAQRMQMVQAQRMQEERNLAIADYNRYAQAEMQEPDFQEVTKYATTDYFVSLPPAEQSAVVGAYARVERNAASLQDVYLVKNHFQNAKTAYRARSGSGAPARKTNKTAQATRFPRSTQIQGSGGSGGGVTEGQLRKMLDEMPWNDIPQEYQKMLLGMN